MAKRSLILTTNSQGGKKIQKTITDINPNADSETMLAFAQKLNALTTNTYERTDCVEKYNIDTEDAPSKPEPTLTVQNQTGTDGITLQFLNNYTDGGGIRCMPITYNGDGELYAYTKEPGVVVGITTWNQDQTATGTYLCLRPAWPVNGSKPKTFTAFTIYIVATEGENYAAKTIELLVE